MASKNTLYEKVFEMGSDYGMTKAHAKSVVDMTLEAIKEAIKEDGDLRMREFGRFKVQTRKGFTRSSPLCGKYTVDDKQVVKFTCRFDV